MVSCAISCWLGQEARSVMVWEDVLHMLDEDGPVGDVQMGFRCSSWMDLHKVLRVCLDSMSRR